MGPPGPAAGHGAASSSRRGAEQGGQDEGVGCCALARGEDGCPRLLPPAPAAVLSRDQTCPWQKVSLWMGPPAPRVTQGWGGCCLLSPQRNLKIFEWAGFAARWYGSAASGGETRGKALQLLSAGWLCILIIASGPRWSGSTSRPSPEALGRDLCFPESLELWEEGLSPRAVKNRNAERLLGPCPVCGGPKRWVGCEEHRRAVR